MVRWILGVIVGLILALAGVVVLAWLLWVLWKRREQRAEAPVIEIEAEAPPLVPFEVEKAGPALAIEAEEPKPPAEKMVEAAAPAPAEELTPPQLDDLKVIEGIGPKIATVLQAADITTFAQLAATDPSRLEQILEEADPRLRRLADPASWPEQARLAAAGDWEALRALQAGLKAGRRA